MRKNTSMWTLALALAAMPALAFAGQGEKNVEKQAGQEGCVCPDHEAHEMRTKSEVETQSGTDASKSKGPTKHIRTDRPEPDLPAMHAEPDRGTVSDIEIQRQAGRQPVTLRRVQRELKELGYYDGKVTGTLNKATKQAIMQFQNEHQLAATGNLDDATLEIMDVHVPYHHTGTGLERDTTRTRSLDEPDPTVAP